MKNCITAWVVLWLALPGASGASAAEKPIDIGSRLELFVDSHLIGQLTGAQLHLHRPTPKEVVFVADRPWEGNTCAYFTLFRDGDLYRMYYRGAHFDEKTRKAAHREVTCYAESRDGIRWTRPELGLFQFDGSRKNNIVWDGPGTHNFTPFKDTNPECSAEGRYKALASNTGKGKRGLLAFQSADGTHWKRMREEPVITRGAFDSQNLAFWDSQARRYREFHRGFQGGVRDIMTGTSTDFLRWTDPVFLDYPKAPKEHLYTNAIQPYERAPHLLLGFPTRFRPDRGQQTEPVFMASRDGRTFQRWPDPVIPVTSPKDRTGNRSNYMTWGLLRLPNADREYSVYATEAYYAGPAGRLRRFTYRVDGFVSVRASDRGGELLTKPLIFRGKKLVLNFTTAPKGSVRVEIQDGAGKALERFALSDCRELRGDAIEQTVAWKDSADVSKLVGRPVRLRLRLQGADLYSFRFVE